jgi:hypothetical protein
MKPEQIVAAAKRAKRKPKLTEFRTVAEELRRKGMTWREIAAFLGTHGVKTTHTAVFRLLRPSLAIPLNTSVEGRSGLVIVGGHPYIANPFGLTRPYNHGRQIKILEKIAVILHENRFNTSFIWCEMQFLLNERPSDNWLQYLADALGGTCELKHRVVLTPQKIRLVFEGREVAMHCWRIELRERFAEFKNAIQEANSTARKELVKTTAELREAELEWRELIASVYPGDAADEAAEHHKYYDKHQRELDREFDSLEID